MTLPPIKFNLASITFLLPIMLLFSCNNEEATVGGAMAIDIVTGVRYFDENGSAISKTGNPNVTNNDFLKVFPNPINGFLYVECNQCTSFEFWLVGARKDTTYSDFDFTALEFEFSDEILDSKQLYSGTSTSEKAIIDFVDLEKGYYRLFLKDGRQNNLVENIYFDPSQTGNEMIAFLNEEF